MNSGPHIKPGKMAGLALMHAVVPAILFWALIDMPVLHAETLTDGELLTFP